MWAKGTVWDKGQAPKGPGSPPVPICLLATGPRALQVSPKPCSLSPGSWPVQGSAPVWLGDTQRPAGAPPMVASPCHPPTHIQYVLLWLKIHSVQRDQIQRVIAAATCLIFNNRRQQREQNPQLQSISSLPATMHIHAFFEPLENSTGEQIQ